MERIELDVSRDIARKWNLTSESERHKILAILKDALELIVKDDKGNIPAKGYGLPDEEAIKEFRNRTKKSITDYEQSLERLRKKAKSNGLTEEILERLLNE